MQHSHSLAGSSGSPLPERFLSRLAGFADLFTRPTWSNASGAACRCHSGARQAHRHGGAAHPRARAGDRLPHLPPCPQPSRVVVSRRGAACCCSCWSQAFLRCRCPGRDRARRHHRAALGSTRSAPAASIAIRSAPPRDTSSKPVACAGYPPSAGARAVGRPHHGRCPSSPCLRRPNASMPASHARPRRCSTGPARPPCKSTAGCPIAASSSSPTAPSPPSSSSPPSGNHVCVVTRLRLDANLLRPHRPNARAADDRRSKASAWHKALRFLKDPKVPFGNATASASGMAEPIASSRSPPAPPSGIAAACRRCRSDGCWSAIPSANSSRRPSSPPISTLSHGDILAWFVCRWQVEVTFEETRAHLGVETQRQWSDKAILRTTPALLGLFSLVTLWAHDLAKSRKLKPRTAAWYPKAVLTFSDAIAAIRREIWAHQIIAMSRPSRDTIEIPRNIWQRMTNALAYAA